MQTRGRDNGENGGLGNISARRDLFVDASFGVCTSLIAQKRLLASEFGLGGVLSHHYWLRSLA